MHGTGYFLIELIFEIIFWLALCYFTFQYLFPYFDKIVNSEYVNSGNKFSGNPTDYCVKTVTFSNGSKKYQPWAKTNKGKWTDIKISDPSLDDLEVSNLFDTYEEAKYVCDNCCAQNATIVSIN